MDFRGFDSSIILILRGGILTSIGDFPECLSQAILVGIMLAWRLGVSEQLGSHFMRGGSFMQPADSNYCDCNHKENRGFSKLAGRGARS